MSRFHLVLLLIALLLVSVAGSTYAALDLEGQSGIFLNSLAYANPAGATEVSVHYISLRNLGSVETYSLSTALKGNIELGYTNVGSDVSGIHAQNNLLAKWQFIKEQPYVPAIAVWAIYRSVSGDMSSADFGLNASKIFMIDKEPLVVDLGGRSTRAADLGLFGFGPDRKELLEGSLAYNVTGGLWVATEAKAQIAGRAWTDLAVRYVVSKNLNLDVGVANLAPGLSHQIAAGATYRF